MPKSVGKSKPFTGSKKKDYPYWWSFFRTLRILWLRPQNPKNPKDPKNRTTERSYFPILQVILFLFNLSFAESIILHQWKSAIVVLIFKKESKYSPTNNHPISLTCVLCRVFECIMSESLLHHFMSHNLLSPYHFGYLPGRSSCSQLLSVINHWFTWFTSFDDRLIVNLFTSFTPIWLKPLALSAIPNFFLSFLPWVSPVKF